MSEASAGPVGGTPGPPQPAVPAQAPAGADADTSAAGTEPEGGTDQDAGGAAGSAESATSATAKPGQGSRRYEFLRGTDRQTIGGDQVFGDKKYYFGGATTAARPSPLPSLLVEAVRNAFEEPAGWAEVGARAGGHAVVIVTGDVGWGKQGAAIRLLLATPTRQLLQLDRDIEFSQLADQIHDGICEHSGGGLSVGFLLDQPNRVRSLTGSALQRVEEALSRAGAQLVLTIGSDVSHSDPDLSRFVVEMQGPPDFQGVLARHLSYDIRDDQAAKLLDEPANRHFVAENLADDPSCSKAVALAAELAAEHRRCASEGGEFNLDRVRKNMSPHGAPDHERWFAGLPDTRSRCLAISLAVLSGLSYESVAAGARALLARFTAAAPSHLVVSSGDDIAPEGMRPFLVARRERLRMLRAHIEQADISGGSSQVVEFNDGRFAIKVLEHAWSGFDVQDSLLQWLCRLAEDESEQIRIYAGVALGQLAAWSFEYMYDSVLMRWATSDQRSRREAVAYALRRVVRAEPPLLRPVRLLVDGWYANRDYPYCQATAARAYGLALGALDPLAAIAALARLLIVEHIDVAIDIGRGLTDLLAPAADPPESAGAGDADDRVRAALAELTVAVADRQRTSAAQMAFLIVASELISYVGAPDAADIEWPTLLLLTQRLADIRGPVVALWRSVLDAALFHEAAEQVMTAWASQAEADDQVRAAFLRFARAVARGHPRCHSILSRYAEQWVSTENLRPLPSVSNALAAVLAAESEGA